VTSEPFLLLIQRLAAISQTGLAFATSEFDRLRFDEIRGIAAELASFGQTDAVRVAEIFRTDDGYATPKLIVRAAVFDHDRILMARETADGLWTLPGGWIDIGESPALAAEREVREETGYDVRAIKLAAVFDKLRHHHPPAPHHAYLVFFLCEVLGGEARPSIETSEVAWFAQHELPPLSTGRSTGSQILRMFDHHRQPNLPTDFD
jgi:ADP-ribose pyrophosphatase YjhB (NUDIX family)